MDKIKKNLISLKKKLILLGLLTNLTSISLTGCGFKKNYEINENNIDITWENDEVVSGTISYDDILGNIKVVILEQNGTIAPLIKEEDYTHETIPLDDVYLSYINIKNGKTFIKYFYDRPSANEGLLEPTSIKIGKQITILEEHEFYDYLYEFGEICSEFDVSKLIDFYNNEVEPKLLEYIANEYHYTK